MQSLFLRAAVRCNYTPFGSVLQLFSGAKIQGHKTGEPAANNASEEDMEE
jgi:hypothetical protein